MCYDKILVNVAAYVIPGQVLCVYMCVCVCVVRSKQVLIFCSRCVNGCWLIVLSGLADKSL